MGILNYRIDKVEGKIEKRGADKVDVKEAFSIIEVDKKNDKMANVKWGFDVDYGGIGKLSLEGTLDFLDSKLDEKVVEKTVKGKKKLVLQGEGLREVSNFILRRGIIEAVGVAKMLQLPAPIQLPTVRVEKKE